MAKASPPVPSPGKAQRSAPRVGPAGEIDPGRLIPARTRVLLAVAVGVVVFLTFLPTLRAGFVDWDDTDSFIRNPSYRGLGGDNLKWMFTTFHMGHYQPLAWLTLGFDYTWGKALLPPDPVNGPGMNALSYHLTNNTLHALNSVLVFLLALELLAIAMPPRSGRRWGLALAALFAALFFGLHPLRAESVSWITQRRDLLSAFFYLLTILIYLRAQRLAPARRRNWLLAALGTFLLCNLSKVIGVTLPFILFILDVYPLRRLGSGVKEWFSSRSRPVLLEKAPFLAIALVFAVIASRGQAGMGALVPLSMHPLSGRIGVVAYGFLFYLWKTLLPIHLVPIYELHLPVRLAEPRFALSIAGAVLLTAAVIWSRKRLPAVAAAFACYLVLFLPTSGIIQNGWQLVHDRYGYLSTIGWDLVLAGALLVFGERVRNGSRNAIVAAAALVLALLAVAASLQSRIWTSTATLWTHAARYAADSSFAQNGIGYVLMEQGKDAESEQHLRQALQIRSSNAKAWENLYELYRKTKRHNDALAICRQALAAGMAAGPWNFKMGVVQTDRGEVDDAIASYRRAVTARPKDPPSHFNMAILLAGKGDLAGAEEHFVDALKADPRFNPARLNLAIVYERQNRIDAAIRILEEALRVDPNYAKGQRALDRLKSLGTR